MLKVIGAGAVGMLLSAYFIEAGFHVQMVTRRREQAEMLNRNGLTLIKGDKEFRYPILASSELGPAVNNQLHIVAVKSYNLMEIDSLLTKIDVHSPLLFVQNGLSHLEYAKKIPHRHIAFGSIEHGALKVGEHTVNHTGIGMLRLAMYRGDESQFKLLLQSDLQDFPIRVEENAEEMLLRKTILNSLINPLTTILQVKNGELLKLESLQLLEALYNEIISAFPEMGKSVTFEDVMNLCKRTAENRSSMLSDRMAGKKTEADAITGALLRMAELRNSKLPSLQVLHSLIQALEEGGQLE